MRKVMPGEELLGQYLRIYSLNDIREIIRGRGASSELTASLLNAHNSQHH